MFWFLNLISILVALFGGLRKDIHAAPINGDPVEDVCGGGGNELEPLEPGGDG